MKDLKILVIDDEDKLASVIQQRLEIEGYRAVAASSAAEGYAAFRDFKPHLVLADIVLGEQNGIDLVGELRKQNPAIQAIYMTGDVNRYCAELENEKRLYHAGLLEKPFKASDLIELISKCANGGRRRAA